ncbi:MAG: hypothetical protein IH594_09540 [Bacteroidales bacterium]|nr:hypothetical protein [Bacteroidales bacterium]
MKTKVLLVLALFSMISLGGNAQGINNESGYGFTGYRSIGFPNNYDPGRNLAHGNERKFNFAFVPSTGDDSLGSVAEGVNNKMTCTDEITTEQVGLIFDVVKTFPEDTEISIAVINKGRVFFYGLKRQNNTIINIENHSSCEYNSAVAIDIKNETGIVILSNVPGLSKRKSKFYTLCSDLLATLSNDKQ